MPSAGPFSSLKLMNTMCSHSQCFASPPLNPFLSFCLLNQFGSNKTVLGMVRHKYLALRFRCFCHFVFVTFCMMLLLTYIIVSSHLKELTIVLFSNYKMLATAASSARVRVRNMNLYLVYLCITMRAPPQKIASCCYFLI